MKQIFAFLFQNSNRSFYYACEERQFNQSLDNAKRGHFGWKINGGISQ
jgi:hypothetical protein